MQAMFKGIKMDLATIIGKNYPYLALQLMQSMTDKEMAASRGRFSVFGDDFPYQDQVAFERARYDKHHSIVGGAAAAAPPPHRHAGGSRQEEMTREEAIIRAKALVGATSMNAAEIKFSNDNFGQIAFDEGTTNEQLGALWDKKHPVYDEHRVPRRRAGVLSLPKNDSGSSVEEIWADAGGNNNPRSTSAQANTQPQRKADEPDEVPVEEIITSDDDV